VVRETPGKVPGVGVNRSPAACQPGGLRDLTRNNRTPESKQDIDKPPTATCARPYPALPR